MTTYQTLSVGIIKDPEWNSRTKRPGQEGKDEQAKLTSLAADIKERGVQTPIEVEGPTEDSGFILVYGSRRLAATKLAGLTEIPALVRPLSEKRVRMVRNAVENLQQSNLTPFEIARTCYDLRKEGYNLDQIRNFTGFSKSHISNCCVMMEKLAPAVQAEWANNNPAAKFDYLRTLANEPDHETQIKTLDAEARKLQEAEEKKEEGGASPTGRGRPKGGGGVPMRAIGSRLQYAVDFAKRGRTPSMIGDGNKTITKSFMVNLMDWLCGQVEAPPPGMLDEPTKPAEKPAKPAEKPAKAPQKGGKK